MSKEIIREEIDNTIETIEEQWQIIRAYEGKIPYIEVDIFMGNIRKLYDDMRLLEKINKTQGINPEKIKSKIIRQPSVSFESNSAPASPEDDTAIKPEAGLDQKKKPVFEPSPDPELINSRVEKSEPAFEIHAEQKEQNPVEPELITENQQDIEEEPFPVSNPIHPATDLPDSETKGELNSPSSEAVQNYDTDQLKDQPNKTPAPKKPMPAPDLFGSHTPTLADKYQAETKSVKDQLAEKENDNTLGGKMQQSQITDLKSAIGINDKFLFINELFKGDLAGYNRAIENLNNCHSKDEAMQKLHNLSLELSWSEHSSSFLRLTEFLKRRYTH